MNEINKEEFRKFAVQGRGISGSVFDDYSNHVENMTQYVIEERPGNFRAIDVFTRLISDRIIFLGLPVDSQIANIITAQLLFLESSDPKKDIIMYINSPGGSVYDGLGIYDTMQYVNPEVATICTGMAASMAAVLMASGQKGKRDRAIFVREVDVGLELLMPIGLGEAAVALGEVGGDGNRRSVELVGQEVEAARELSRQVRDAIREVDSPLVDLEVLEHEGHCGGPLEQANR